jgi:hypothetical protein
MSLKDLSIDRDLIDEAIKSIDGVNVSSVKDTSKDVKQYIVHKDDPKNSGILNIYSKGSLTTLWPQGKNMVLANEVAEHIKATCIKGSTKPVCLSFGKVEVINFDLIRDFLTEECKATLTTQSISNGIKYTFVGIHQDSMALTYYDNRTLLIQGKQQFLYIDLIEILSETLNYKDVITQQLKTIDVGTTIQETIDEFKQVFPTSHVYLGNTLISIMSPSLVLKKLNVQLTDYSSLVFPMLKGLEGYLKLIFSEYNITITKDGFGEFFNHDNLNKDTRAIINNGKIISLIENIYKYYKTNRHGLFHIDGNITSSRIISNQTEANVVINKVIEIIEMSHHTLQKENTTIGKIF